jgi:hypothetical protein
MRGSFREVVKRLIGFTRANSPVGKLIRYYDPNVDGLLLESFI